MTEDDVAMVSRLTLALPRTDALALAAAVAGGDGGVAAHRAMASSAPVRQACDQISGLLGTASAEELAGVIRGVLHTKALLETKIDVVWTGPLVDSAATRLTSAVVTELVDAARSEVLLVSYAMHSEASLRMALDRAVERGVRVTLLAESPIDNPSFSSWATPFPGLPARRLRWPYECRAQGAALHAKILVVDRRIALVGSANVTENAMERNLECGLRVENSTVASSLIRHVEALLSERVLRE